MSKKVKFLLLSFSSLGVLLLGEFAYLYSYKSLQREALQDKLLFTSYITLPDLAISQESSLRHRSLSSVFEIYSLDPVLREYAKATYVLSNKNEKR